MKRLKLFFHELSRLDAAVLDTFPALKSMESPAEMLHYVQGIYVKVFEELKTYKADAPADKIKTLELCQLFRKILTKAMKYGEPAELSKFDSIYSLPDSEKKKLINEVVNKFNRQL
jgi:hypothetical protein